MGRGEVFDQELSSIQVSVIVQSVKNLSAMQETWVHSLGWEDPLEKGMASQSSVFAWRILWIEEPGTQQSMGSVHGVRKKTLQISVFQYHFLSFLQIMHPWLPPPGGDIPHFPALRVPLGSRRNWYHIAAEGECSTVHASYKRLCSFIQQFHF